MNGERLKAERLRRCLTQREFGKLLDVSESTISCYEKGTRVPPIHKLLFMAATLNLTIDYLMGQDIYVVNEEEVSYGIKMAQEDFTIMTAIKKEPSLYYRFYREPDRTVKQICNLFEKDNY